MPAIDPDNLQYQCSFCGKRVQKASEGGERFDPCAIVLISKFEQPESQQGVQQFFCHLTCFEAGVKNAMVERDVLEGGDT